jgi:hypothetical protein
MPDNVGIISSVLSCRQIGYKFNINANLLNECYTDDYWNYIPLPIIFLIIWIIVIPATLFMTLK